MPEQTAIVTTGSSPTPAPFIQRHENALSPKIILERECQYLADLIEIADTLKVGVGNIPFGGQAYNFTLKSYHMIQDDIRKQQDRVRDASSAFLQHVEEQQHQARWQQQYEMLLQQLMIVYGDMGPQYHILIKRLAFAEVKAQQMEEAGRVESVEWRKMVQEVRDLVAALQKYTETEKKELISGEVQNAVLAVVEIVEAELANRYPKIWQRIIHQIESRVDASEGTDG